MILIILVIVVFIIIKFYSIKKMKYIMIWGGFSDMGITKVIPLNIQYLNEELVLYQTKIGLYNKNFIENKNKKKQQKIIGEHLNELLVEAFILRIKFLNKSLSSEKEKNEYHQFLITTMVNNYTAICTNHINPLVSNVYVLKFINDLQEIDQILKKNMP